MFESRSHSRGRRRGVILVVILGMLGLLALIGVTFATFSGQARINARNFSQAQNLPRLDRDDGLRAVATDRRHGATRCRRSGATACCATCTATTPRQRLPGPRSPDGTRGVPTSRASRPTPINGIPSPGLLQCMTNIPLDDAVLLRLRLHPLDRAVHRPASSRSERRTPLVPQTLEVLDRRQRPASAHASLNGCRRLHGDVVPTTLHDAMDDDPTLETVREPLPDQIGGTDDPVRRSTAATCTRSTGRGWAHVRASTATSGSTAACSRATRQRPRAGRPERRRHGRGLRRLRPGELVPRHPERRRPGDHPLVPPAGRSSGPTRRVPDRPERLDRRPRSTNDWRNTCGRLGGADPPPAQRRRPLAVSFPDLMPDPTPARSPTTSTTTATASPTRSGSTSATRPRATPRGSSTSRSSPSWSSASTAGSR